MNLQRNTGFLNMQLVFRFWGYHSGSHAWIKKREEKEGEVWRRFAILKTIPYDNEGGGV